ncbi:disulfide bond formation protein B, partial [Francisella tularensis subsp. holarctica]|nr:disulfide bond formation protein B [Francisella tularensis subsp. holarctica]
MKTFIEIEIIKALSAIELIGIAITFF